MSSGVHIRRFVRKGNIMRARGRTMRSKRRKKRVATLRRLSYDNVIGHCANNGSTKERSIIFAHHVWCGRRRGGWGVQRIRRRGCPHSGSELQCKFSVITETHARLCLRGRVCA